MESCLFVLGLAGLKVDLGIWRELDQLGASSWTMMHPVYGILAESVSDSGVISIPVPIADRRHVILHFLPFFYISIDSSFFLYSVLSA